MERTTWTDERLDDLSRRMDAGFERVDRDIRDLRTEMREEFADVRVELRGGFADVRTEMREEFAAMRDQLSVMQSMMWRFGGAMIATFGAGLVAVAVRGG